jgi:hypothetical protein
MSKRADGEGSISRRSDRDVREAVDPSWRNTFVAQDVEITATGRTGPDGHQVATALTMRGTITADFLRSLADKFDGLLDMGAAMATLAADDSGRLRHDDGVTAATLDALQSGRRRKHWDRAALQEVADVYLAAKSEGRSVSTAVASYAGVGDSRARHLIKEARTAGLLPPCARRGS